MKNVFIYLFLTLPLWCSCRISDPENPSANAYSLREYAYNLFQDKIVSPVRIMDGALLLQMYNDAGEEERKDPKFDMIENALHIDDNTLQLESFGKIETGGSSLLAGGTVWDVWSYYVHYKITKTDSPDSTWIMSYQVEDEEENYVEVSYKTENGLDRWNVLTEGKDYGRKVKYYSVYGTGDEPVSMFRKTGGNYSDFYPVGKFKVEIFNVNEMLDYCYVIYESEQNIRVETSR